MSLILAGAGLLASGIGKGIQAFKNAQNNKQAEADYNRQRGQLLTDMYASPLDSLTNKALLTQADRRLEKANEAIENQAAASGATFENTLAAKQAANETMADMVTGLVQGETARRDAYKSQLLNLDSQRSAQQMAARQQAGAAWASLGDNVASTLTTLGGTMLENDIPLKDLFKFR